MFTMTTKTNYSAAEAHFLCDVCSEAVTNPICPSCLTTEIEAWLTLYPNLKQALLPRLTNFINKTEDRSLDSTECIICHNKRAAACPYCFTQKVLTELKKIHADKMILKEFFEFFNFDFDHNGYSKEAEDLGVI